MASRPMWPTTVIIIRPRGLGARESASIGRARRGRPRRARGCLQQKHQHRGGVEAVAQASRHRQRRRTPVRGQHEEKKLLGRQGKSRSRIQPSPADDSAQAAERMRMRPSHEPEHQIRDHDDHRATSHSVSELPKYSRSQWARRSNTVKRRSARVTPLAWRRKQSPIIWSESFFAATPSRLWSE